MHSKSLLTYDVSGRPFRNHQNILAFAFCESELTSLLTFEMDVTPMRFVEFVEVAERGTDRRLHRADAGNHPAWV